MPEPSFLEQTLGNPYLLLFLLLGVGMALGKISIKGINLGTSGVLFLALVAGHFGYTVPAATGTIGLLLFAYCVGVGAGNRFFSSLKREGIALLKLSVVVVLIGTATTYAVAWLFNIPFDLAGGLFAGALTSTPALAAATEALSTAGQSNLVVGYGIAYPFGVIAVVLFVQLLPRILKIDLSQMKDEVKDEADDIVRTALVEVTNPNLAGKKISNSGLEEFESCTVSRVQKGAQLVPLRYEDTFSIGQKLYLVGRNREMKIAIDYLGEECKEPLVRDAENERRLLLVTSKNVVGRTIKEIGPLREHGVIVTRVRRLDYEFAAGNHTRIENGDQITVVGPQESLATFSDFVGHRPQSLGETDLISLSIGLALGILFGMVPFALPGSSAITLGLAGGPLLVGLILGHFGKVGKITGYIPRPTRLLLQEFGLALFLASAGIKGGMNIVETLMTQGWTLLVAGMLIVIVPLCLAYFVCRKFLKLNFLQTLGGACGAMTSTPALGVISSKTESPVPVISYATAYPAALILMTVFAKMIVSTT
ncbi:aspartate:alanine exchanger family transporter [Puniceicoccus vermicola]|uniref:YidE/YbjL duplication n=1 Tax=Puniceicoccus vermicola TaxID=388746 RepID=A0A7X1B299_9BACT|nr:aspartate:alanine exchanger family transporter [Puniceicoccus vermicola]MBC2604306.1 YidE/YbjL duplication [Puniceicoccus vermicola]